MNRIFKRLTYANVMSSLAIFLVLGGGAAFAAGKLGKNSVGTKQLKSNSVTTAKIKKDAVTGAKVKESTLATVPNSAATDVVKASQGTIAAGQQATVVEHGPLKLVVKCETYETTELAAHAYIESSTTGTVFASWVDGSKELGPTTPEEERELNNPVWGSASSGPYSYDSSPDGSVSATASNGQGLNAFIGLAAEKDTNTCWYWATATIIG